MPTINTPRVRTADTPYRPWMFRTVGVEIEFNTTSRAGASIRSADITAALQGSGTTAPITGDGRWARSDGRSWHVKADGSCGHEVPTPAFYLDANGNNDSIARGVRAIAALAPKVDSRCGLHVWVDCSDFDHEDLRRLVTLWARYEPFFFSMMPPSRQNNTYCLPLRKSTWDGRESPRWPATQRILSARTRSEMQSACAEHEKYVALKTADWWVHGRVEFRLGAGTTDWEKIRRWCMLLASVCERARMEREGAPLIRGGVNQDPTDVDGFETGYVFLMLGLRTCRFVTREAVAPEAQDLRDWIDARREHFAAVRAGRTPPARTRGAV